MDLSNRDVACLLRAGAAAIAVVAWRPGRVAVLGILRALFGKLLFVAVPRGLIGLDRDDARGLIRSTAVRLGHGDLTATQVEDIADQAEDLEPRT
jgi:hypothetical protein